MLKHLMNGSSLLSLAVFDAEADARAALRAKIAANANVEVKSEAEIKAEEDDKDPDNKSDNEGDDNESGEEGNTEDENEDEEGKEGEDDKVEETAEQKTEREKQEKIAAKAQRKYDRMQARIDEATAARRAAEVEIANLKAQLEANPDLKLTEEEVQSRAEAIANKKLQDENLKKLQSDFDNTCADLRKAAIKADKDFIEKVDDMAETFGNIPSFMIGVLGDLDNGGEILAYIANDEDEAERIYDLAKNPAKMAKELALIGIKLEEAKKPKPKKLSRVPSIDPIKSNGARNNNSTTITEADTKDMRSYVAKRIAQREAQKKARGY